jgi:hypothetical protein
VLEVTLGSGDELLIGVTNILVVVTLVAASSDCDSLGPPLGPLLSLLAPLFALLLVILGGTHNIPVFQFLHMYHNCHRTP